MKTANNHYHTARLLIVIYITLVFGAIAWSQPDETDPIYWAYKSGNSIKDHTMQVSLSDNDQEMNETVLNKLNAGVEKLNINPMLYDMIMKKVSGDETLDKELKRKNRLVQKYGIETGLEIYNRNIWIGMSSEMVYESIGEPCDVYVHTVDQGNWIHWEYVLFDISLGFRNGILVCIEDY
ncbi:MAG: hypothetical protein JXB19_08850 [Bacteroidales bacterium]|nr:hypothetical protein [Bacteroidales bacterium]